VAWACGFKTPGLPALHLSTHTTLRLLLRYPALPCAPGARFQPHFTPHHLLPVAALAPPAHFAGTTKARRCT